MSLVSIFRRPVRALLGVAASIAVLLGSGFVPVSSGDLQSQIDAGRSSASSLRSAIAAETARIQQTAGGWAMPPVLTAIPPGTAALALAAARRASAAARASRE